ncbi:MAG: XRE family transcriptional regulator [bacterium]|nr:XRE family transcriptional regulator [bacterium]MDE0500973.1 XRE family transcriptional regulator [bacterium]
MDVELAAVGRNIARLRSDRGLRLSDVAAATGYTTSYLSQIESGSAMPSLTALAMVAIAFGVEMTDLLDSTDPLVHITRAGEGRDLRVGDGPVYRVVGSHGTEGAYTVVILRTSDVPARYRHYGERFLVMLSGWVQINFGDNHFHLTTGDTLHYSAHETHETEGRGEDLHGRILIIACPALF